MIDISIDTGDIDRALDRLAAFPTRRFMDELVELTLRQTDRRFDEKRDPEGQQWKPWSAGYRRSGAPFHSRHTLLHLSGDMQESIRAGSVTSHSAEIGSDVPYASRQNAERQFLGFIDDDPETVDFAIGFLTREVGA